jgi:hypothetical protein
MRKEDIKIFIDGIENPAEPNQALRDAAERLEKYSERFDNKDNELVEGVFNPDNWGRRLVKEKPKQETLEEAANEYSKKKYSIDYGYCEEDYYISFLSFRDGAKWQQERSYSEEEMLEFGEFIFKNTLLVNVKGVEGILKQFKKK